MYSRTDSITDLHHSHWQGAFTYVTGSDRESADTAIEAGRVP